MVDGPAGVVGMAMRSLLLSRSSIRAAGALLLVLAAFLPGACGGKVDIRFVGSTGGEENDTGGNAGMNGGGMGGASGGETNTGGGNTGGGNTGGGNTGGGNTGGTGGTIPETCGDGETNGDEDCDDDGEDSADCDDDCTSVECGDGHTNTVAGEVCDENGEDASCDDDCTEPRCGDGVPNAAAGESCDDGNEDSGDGCTPDCEQEILLLGDSYYASENDAYEVLRAAGFHVAVVPSGETMFDGTNPALDNFCGVISFNSGYNQPMPLAGQEALVDYVDAGGAFMSAGWTAAELELFGGIDAMAELVLMDFESDITSGTYELTPEGATHPLTSNLPTTFTNNSLGEIGLCKPGTVPLINDGAWHGMCVTDGTDGRRVISVGSSFSYDFYRPLQYYEMAQLLINAANWLCEEEQPFPAMAPGSTDVVTRFGYRAQCLAWVDDRCVQPYVAMTESDITAPVPHCIDNLTDLRPVWGYDLPNTAATWCWIATGRSQATYYTYAPYPTNAAGWMYVYGAPGSEVCTDALGRHLSAVEVPTIGPQVWSFDDFTWVRDGNFLDVTCNYWGTP